MSGATTTPSVSSVDTRQHISRERAAEVALAAPDDPKRVTLELQRIFRDDSGEPRNVRVHIMFTLLEDDATEFLDSFGYDLRP